MLCGTCHGTGVGEETRIFGNGEAYIQCETCSGKGFTLKLIEIQKPRPTIEDTIAFIKEAHEGQSYGGKPYWTHPYGVMKLLPAGSTDDERHAALLHDVLEDTKYNEGDLRERGYSDETIQIVKLVSKKDNMPYLEWVEKVIVGSGNKGAMRVKYADNKFNHDADDTKIDPKRKESLKARYAKSMEIIQRAL